MAKSANLVYRLGGQTQKCACSSVGAEIVNIVVMCVQVFEVNYTVLTSLDVRGQSMMNATDVRDICVFNASFATVLGRIIICVCLMLRLCPLSCVIHCDDNVR